MELFHCCNRGVEKRDIVRDEKDRVRFVHELYAMNDAHPAGNAGHFLHMDLRSPYVRKRNRDRRERELLVDIHAWCLMGNHYHLLLSERVDGGITKFLRKFNVGYANYFNERHSRSGALYQGRTKKVSIEEDAQLFYIFHYIHCNPLDFLESARGWRSGVVGSTRAALAHLNGYRWSSYQDYCNIKNFPSLLSDHFGRELYPNYQSAISDFLRASPQYDEYSTLCLE